MSTRQLSGWALTRDILSYVGGWALIVYQALAVPPKDVNEWFLLLGGSLIGVPGVAEILAWRGRGDSGTAGLPLPPPAPVLPERPSSSSPVR